MENCCARATPNAAAEISVAKTRARVSSARVTAIAPEPVPTSTTTSVGPLLDVMRAIARLHQMLGFGTRDQHIRCHAKIAAVKLLASGDVLRRFALQPLVQIAAVVDPFDLGQFFFRMRVKIDAVALESVSEKHFGGEARRDDGVVLQELGALEERGLDGHVEALGRFALLFQLLGLIVVGERGESSDPGGLPSPSRAGAASGRCDDRSRGSAGNCRCGSSRCGRPCPPCCGARRRSLAAAFPVPFRRGANAARARPWRDS